MNSRYRLVHLVLAISVIAAVTLAGTGVAVGADAPTDTQNAQTILEDLEQLLQQIVDILEVVADLLEALRDIAGGVESED
ncbi:hypothetical protein KTS45_17850 [Halomicroarcula limicola]|uniref:Uncharacterized protein n=1 Tax=Haloarcula limicola TaxID=1429915 RepID=A0A8J7Y883_9EURY|nr:hypothetical protein [Halomicroarcula limicola]MBV0926072.1 hypothetical protein [Halomicroarcula limicola]